MRKTPKHGNGNDERKEKDSFKQFFLIYPLCNGKKNKKKTLQKMHIEMKTFAFSAYPSLSRRSLFW